MALKIGELLVQHGLITPQQLDQALEAQRSYGGKLGTNLVELGFVNDVVLAKLLSKQLGIPAAGPKDFEQIPQSVLSLISRETAEEHKLIPIRVDTKITVAISDPADLPSIDDLGFKTGKRVQAVIAPEIWLVAALERHYNIRRQTRYVMLQSEEPSFAGWDVSQGQAGRGTSTSEVNLGGLISENSQFAMQVYVDRLMKVKTKEDVFQALMDFLFPLFPRMAIFIARKEAIVGWMLQGFAVHVSQFHKVEVPKSSDTTFRQVMEDQKPYLGVMPGRPQDEPLVRALQLPSRVPVALRSISFRGKGIAVFLGLSDQAEATRDVKKSEVVTLACLKAGLALELGAIRKALAEIPKE